MPTPEAFKGLRLPAIASPMFLASGLDLVVETCRAGMVGTFPALNQRTSEGFRDWLHQIRDRLEGYPGAAPFGVNLIVHKSNPRLEADLQICIEEKVPLIITSLGAVADLVDRVHAYGGLVFHDVISARHASKAAEAGVDGIIAVAAGAGGHAGTLSPFALVPEIRAVFGGTIILGGAINTGRQIAAARMLGADMAYLGTRFLATAESAADPAYKQMIVDSSAADILYTPRISGVHANFLRPSIVAAGLDPENLHDHGALDMKAEVKVWKELWSAGQGVGSVCDIPAVADLCDRLVAEYRAALAECAAEAARF
ncbi:NAD(P)H-dependent flavin oxidoreductase [Frigidibacter mobilis]|uniref:Nitropropane dioxygenase/trans-enoyl-CoA reductase family protein n=1 Tax=Frigidibacter mobilis TaxID=1335048 RepID=A0A159Z328_9RHOB|nr:nitronate monooxygenase [Frigidibacter mobilis]AMY68520.1 nitropropane dioxygenase/trans-enoyl-CoA reductase family protein [Frigidibacter mobilis]